MYLDKFPGRDIPDPDHPAADPLDLLEQWLPAPRAGDPRRALMALATLGTDGYPNIRHLLASQVSRNGISFHVSSTSTKVEELNALPRAAATMAWPLDGKQLIIQGNIRPQDAHEAASVYHERPEYLKLLAHINTDELARKPAKERKKEWQEYVSGDSAEIPPSTWKGYLLEPTRISFWRAFPDTPSNRHDYYLEDGQWRVVVVAG